MRFQEVFMYSDSLLATSVTSSFLRRLPQPPSRLSLLVPPLCETTSGFKHTRGKAASVGSFHPFLRPSCLLVQSVHGISQISRPASRSLPFSREDAKDFNDALMDYWRGPLFWSPFSTHKSNPRNSPLRTRLPAVHALEPWASHRAT